LATLHIYLTDTYYRTITVHRITDSWDEMEVTWNNFGNAFIPDVVGSFTIHGLGWHEADVTGLVEGWLNGIYSNYGMLLDQVPNWYPLNAFNSREAGINTPYLEICYTTESGTVCEQILAIGDAYIDQYQPEMNAGISTTLFTGASINGCDEIYLSLIKFDEPHHTPGLAAIGDTVWFDEDQDGIQDAGEPGIPDVTVNLYDCSDVLMATTTTDADGYYLFTGLLPGGYYVEFIPPEGYVLTLQDQGADDTIDSDADPVTGRTMCTTLDEDETDVTWDCGLYLREFEGCTLTIGFWKRHAGFGPQPDVVTPLLPIWLGDAGVGKSLHVTTAEIAYNVLQQHYYCHPDNGITKLYAQLLGAKLNIANGANGAAVSRTISRADAFLADNNCDDWDSLSDRMKTRVGKWHQKLDDYNNGLVGPGHCVD